MDEDQPDQYRWEEAYEKTWEAVEVDESGSLQTSANRAAHELRRKELSCRKGNVRLGIMRQVCIIIDMSGSMNDRDLSPTRLACVFKHLASMLDDFYDQNPVSQICLLAVRDKKAEKISDFSCHPMSQREALHQCMEREGSGEFSLQNGLNFALSLLRNTPSHCSREILLLISSISTCDPGDVLSTVQLLKQNKIVCNFIVLSAEVFIYKRTAELTEGKHIVVVDEVDLKESLSLLTIPPPARNEMDSSLVRMGFPQHVESKDHWSFCVCHASSSDLLANLTKSGYFCPQCNAKYCSLPTECRICGLTLISAQHLARSHQQLFPLAPFEELDVSKMESTVCFGCFESIDVRVYICGQCKNRFCIDCNFLIHETIHVCPGCP